MKIKATKNQIVDYITTLNEASLRHHERRALKRLAVMLQVDSIFADKGCIDLDGHTFIQFDNISKRPGNTVNGYCTKCLKLTKGEIA